MKVVRQLLLKRFGGDLAGAAVLQPVLTAIGVFTFIAGVLYLPALHPTRVEMILALLLLAIFALACTAVGQLAVLSERLGQQSGIRKESDAASERGPRGLDS